MMVKESLERRGHSFWHSSTTLNWKVSKGSCSNISVEVVETSEPAIEAESLPVFRAGSICSIGVALGDIFVSDISPDQWSGGVWLANSNKGTAVFNVIRGPVSVV